jgi:hypothetical protein
VPNVLKLGPYRFYFFSNDGHEPPHVHVDRDDSSAKFWLNPVSLAHNYGFASHELTKVERIVENFNVQFLEAWNGYFGTGR